MNQYSKTMASLPVVSWFHVSTVHCQNPMTRVYVYAMASRVLRDARARLVAYHAAVAAASGCEPPVVHRFPADVYARLYGRDVMGAVVVPRTAAGVGVCAGQKSGNAAAQDVTEHSDSAPENSDSAPEGDTAIAPKSDDSDTDIAPKSYDSDTDIAPKNDESDTAPKSDDSTTGGARPPPPKRHVVVDTLNVVHALGMKPSVATIVATVGRVAGALRPGYPGRIMFVVKDRDTEHTPESTRAAYAAAARESGVYVYAVERYKRAPCPAAVQKLGRPGVHHSARGRDDFYAAVLAARWTASVVTDDRFRDFREWRHTLPPFYVEEFSAHAPAARYFVTPAGGAYDRLPLPHTLRTRVALAPLFGE